MRIELARTVKHDGRIYTKGDVITVDEGLGTYYLACGWATEPGETPNQSATAPVVLDVQSAVHKTEVTNG